MNDPKDLSDVFREIQTLTTFLQAPCTACLSEDKHTIKIEGGWSVIKITNKLTALDDATYFFQEVIYNETGPINTKSHK